jgi:hypothetical protein
MPKQKDPSVAATSRIGLILQDLPIADRKAVLEFVAQDGDPLGRRLHAIKKVVGALEELDPEDRKAVLGFFASQIARAEAPSARV